MTAESLHSFDVTQTTDAIFKGGKSVSPDSDGELVIVGGAAGSAGVYSVSKGERLHSLDIGKGSVVDAAWWQDRAIVATSTGAIKVFEDNNEVAELGSHSGGVSGLSLHPCGDILASVGKDKSYLLFDLPNKKLITQVFTESGGFCLAKRCFSLSLLTML